MKKILFIIITIIILMFIGVFFFNNNRNNNDDTVMIINNQKVTKEEYQMIIDKYQAQVKSKYSTEDANKKDFWTINSNGSTPLNEIINLANEELIKNKVLLKIAKDNKIKINVEFNDIKNTILEKNKFKNNSFGLSSYTLYNYYKYLYYTLENEVENFLRKNNSISDIKLKEIYNQNQSMYTYSIGVKMLIAEFNTQESDIKNLSKNLSDKINKCIDINYLKKEFPNVNFYELNMDSINTKEGKSGVYKQRWDIASKMNIGEISDPFKIGENYIIMKCLNKTLNGVKQFDEIKDVLKSELQDYNVQNYINKSIENANIKFKKDILEKTALEILN